MSELDEEFFPINYDLEEVFDTQIQPLLKTIINICDEHDIPMIGCFQYRKDGDKAYLSISSTLSTSRATDSLKAALESLMT